MSTWDDKPNDYEHALAIIWQLRSERNHNLSELWDQQRAEIERLRAALKAMVDAAPPFFHSEQLCSALDAAREALK